MLIDPIPDNGMGWDAVWMWLDVDEDVDVERANLTFEALSVCIYTRTL
jgi:hypothetical protein